MNKAKPSNNPIRKLSDWIQTPLTKGVTSFRLKTLVEKHGLNTVCESASCPNVGSCWSAGTLSLMILGETCTRSCQFCDVPTGSMKPPRVEEPAEIA